MNTLYEYIYIFFSKIFYHLYTLSSNYNTQYTAPYVTVMSSILCWYILHCVVQTIIFFGVDLFSLFITRIPT